MHTEGDVTHDGPDEGAAGAAADDALRGGEPSRSRQPLLHGHEENQGSLSVRPRPVGGPDRRHLGGGPGQAARGELARHPADDLVHRDPWQPISVVVVDGRHVDVVVLEAGESGVLQRRDAVDRGDGGARLDDGRPSPSHDAERAVVHGHRLAPVQTPPSACHLAVDVVSSDPGRREHGPRDDPVRGLGELEGQAATCVSLHQPTMGVVTAASGGVGPGGGQPRPVAMGCGFTRSMYLRGTGAA